MKDRQTETKRWRETKRERQRWRETDREGDREKDTYTHREGTWKKRQRKRCGRGWKDRERRGKPCQNVGPEGENQVEEVMAKRNLGREGPL